MPGFTLSTADGSLSVTLPFGPTEPKKIGGGPVLARVQIPEAKELTEWTHRKASQIQVSFFLSDWEDRQGAEFERKVRILERMAGEDEGDPEPPELIILGDPPGSVPKDYHDASHLRWWIEDYTEAPGAKRNSAGNRIEVGGTITLTEVSRDQGMRAKLRSNRAAKKPKKYTVKKGDTLSKIAAAYKIKGGWHTLAKLNNIRDPKRIKFGQEIRLS